MPVPTPVVLLELLLEPILFELLLELELLELELLELELELLELSLERPALLDEPSELEPRVPLALLFDELLLLPLPELLPLEPLPELLLEPLPELPPFLAIAGAAARPSAARVTMVAAM